MPANEVIAAINAERPAVVFMPHVETSTGIILSDEYIAGVATAARNVGALVVVDGIAAGCAAANARRVDASPPTARAHTHTHTHVARCGST